MHNVKACNLLNNTCYQILHSLKVLIQLENKTLELYKNSKEELVLMLKP